MISQMIAVAAAFAVVGDICANLISASQIDKFDEAKDGGCQRRWAWRYVARIPDDAPGAAAELGTECDDTQLQPYLRDDRAIDYSRRSGYIVQPGLAYLPKPKSPGIEVQRHFVMLSASGLFGFQGYVDLWVPDASVMPDLAYDPKQGPRVLEDGTRPPVVDDFKTTGNWKYLKTPKILETDTQAQLYAKWAMVHTGAPVVDLIWTTFATKGAYRAKRSHLRVTADHVDAQMKRIEELATQIHFHRTRKTNPLGLLPNVRSCEAFNKPCPYSANCNLSPSQIIDAKAAQHARQQKEIPIMSNVPSTTAGTLARLKAQKAAALAGGGAPVAPPLPEVTKAGIPVANLPSHALPPTCAPEDVPAPTQIPSAFLESKPFVGINPPEKDLPPAPPVGSVQAPPPAPVQVAPASNAVGQTPEPVRRRGPGRPRKAPVDPIGADAAMHATPPQTAGQAAASALIEAIEGGVLAAGVEHPATVTNNVFTGDALLESVSVTWAEETLCPVAYNPFKVGPFEATGFVRRGETISQASARIYAELVSFAEEARAQKAISFKATLDAIGGGR